MRHQAGGFLSLFRHKANPELHEGENESQALWGPFTSRQLCWCFVFLAAILGQAWLRLRHGLGAFTSDDLMNLWVHCIRVSWSHEILNCLTFAEPLDRSGAVFFYRPLFETFHMNFLPFAIGHAFLLGLNSIIVFEFLRFFSSGKPALLLTIVFSGLPMFLDIYYSTGTVYDLVSSLSVWTAVLIWLHCLKRVEVSKSMPWVKLIFPVLTAALLYQVSLAAKELAIFPFLFASCLGLLWLRARALPIFLLPCIQSAWYVLRKLDSSIGMIQNPGYRWSSDSTLLWENTVWYFRWATDFMINEPTPIIVALAAVLIFVVVVHQRSIPSVLSLCLLLVAFTFVLGLFRRNLYVFFVLIPLVPLLFLRSLRFLERLNWPTVFISIATVALAQMLWCEYRWERYGTAIANLMTPASIALQALRERPVAVKRGGVVLVRQDPFPAQDYSVQILLSLYRSDVNLTALRVKFGENKDPATGLDKEVDAETNLGSVLH